MVATPMRTVTHMPEGMFSQDTAQLHPADSDQYVHLCSLISVLGILWIAYALKLLLEYSEVILAASPKKKT